MFRLKDLPTHIEVHIVIAYIIPILLYPPKPLYASSRTLDKMQTIQNKPLRFAYNEKYPNTKNTKTLQELLKLEPIEFTLHMRAEGIKKKITEQEEGILRELLSNYEK